MKMRKPLLFATMLLTAMSFAFSSCKKDPAPRPDAEAIEFLGSNDTIYIKYDGTLDLSEWFRIAPPRAQGTLVYRIDRQPDYREGADANAPYTRVDAYSVSGNTLTSIEGVRVPGVVIPRDGIFTLERQRAVREGRLEVSLQGDASVEPLIIVIVQTDKPALVPVVTVSYNPLNTEIGGKMTRVLTNQGSTTSFNNSSFTIDPMDLEYTTTWQKVGDESRWVSQLNVGIVAVNAPYINDTFQAGGEGADPSSGGYILGYHNSMTREQALAEPETSTRVARLYVDIIAEDPESPIVGIVLNEAAISANTDTGVQFFQRIAPFTTNSNRSPSSFILAKLENGTTRAWGTGGGAGGRDGSLIVGELSEYMQLVTLDANNPGWSSSIRLQFDPEVPVGTPVSFTVARLRLGTTTLDQNPGPEQRVRVETHVIANPAL